MTPRAIQVLGAASLLAFLSLASPIHARDHLLTIGGGYSADGNQLSLEQNVVHFRRLLAERQMGAVPHDILFSDGNSPQRDVQYLAADAVPRANRLMAQLFDREANLGITYRNHELTDIRAGSNLVEVRRWFAEVGSRLAAADRLFIYATAHGGESSDRFNPQNSRLYLWNHEELSVSELAQLLATLPRGVQVTLVMVQCYSGGFANLIFENGDPNGNLVDRDIAGFFATVFDRVAAGCTPDIQAADYQEYSTHFWAALGGKTRDGRPIESPDFDQNDVVSLDEAHNYVILHSSTIDIPVRTSDALLRKYSGLANGPASDLVGMGSHEQLLPFATPSERAVLEGLSKELALVGRNRVRAAQFAADTATSLREVINRRERRSEQQLASAREEIVGDLTQVWPELENPYNPQTIELLTTRRDQFVQAVQAHPRFADFVSAHAAREDALADLLDADRQEAKAQRFIRISENVALAANLAVLAEPSVVLKYQRLISAERAALNASPQPIGADGAPAIPPRGTTAPRGRGQ